MILEGLRAVRFSLSVSFEVLSVLMQNRPVSAGALRASADGARVLPTAYILLGHAATSVIYLLHVRGLVHYFRLSVLTVGQGERGTNMPLCGKIGGATMP